MQATGFLTREFAALLERPIKAVLGADLYDRYQDEQILAGARKPDAKDPLVFGSAQLVRGVGNWEIRSLEFAAPVAVAAPAATTTVARKK